MRNGTPMALHSSLPTEPWSTKRNVNAFISALLNLNQIESQILSSTLFLISVYVINSLTDEPFHRIWIHWKPRMNMCACHSTWNAYWTRSCVFYLDHTIINIRNMIKMRFISHGFFCSSSGGTQPHSKANISINTVIGICFVNFSNRPLIGSIQCFIKTIFFLRSMVYLFFPHFWKPFQY